MSTHLLDVRVARVRSISLLTACAGLSTAISLVGCGDGPASPASSLEAPRPAFTPGQPYRTLLRGLFDGELTAVPPGWCAVSGGGDLAAGDSFGGTARGDVEPLATGTWIHVTPHADVLRGTVGSLACRSDGGGGPLVNRAVIGGLGVWNGEDGFEFRVSVADRGDPDGGQDEYIIAVLDPEGALRYLGEGLLVGGNLRIHHPDNP